MSEEVKQINATRPISIYLADRKIGEVKSGDYKLNSNRDAIHTDGGYSGHTAGSLLVTMNIETMVGVNTTTFGQLHALVIAGGYVRMALPVEGDVIMFTGIIKEAGLKWDHGKGSCDGNASFEGGRVQQQGAV